MRLRTGPSMTSEGEGAAIVKSSERGGGREMGWSEHHQERVVKEGRGQLSEGFERFLAGFGKAGRTGAKFFTHSSGS